MYNITVWVIIKKYAHTYWDIHCFTVQGKADEQLVLAVCSHSTVRHVPPDQVSQTLSSSSTSGQSDAETIPPSRKRIKREKREDQTSSGNSTTTVPHPPVPTTAVRQECVPFSSSTSVISYKVCNRVVQKWVRMCFKNPLVAWYIHCMLKQGLSSAPWCATQQCSIPYTCSAKFWRRIIFAVLADWPEPQKLSATIFSFERHV